MSNIASECLGGTYTVSVEHEPLRPEYLLRIFMYLLADGEEGEGKGNEIPLDKDHRQRCHRYLHFTLPCLFPVLPFTSSKLSTFPNTKERVESGRIRPTAGHRSQ